jgi:hypothetical protein
MDRSSPAGLFAGALAFFKIVEFVKDADVPTTVMFCDNPSEKAFAGRMRRSTRAIGRICSDHFKLRIHGGDRRAHEVDAPNRVRPMGVLEEGGEHLLIVFLDVWAAVIAGASNAGEVTVFGE